jgi:hypothetical protein
MFHGNYTTGEKVAIGFGIGISGVIVVGLFGLVIYKLLVKTGVIKAAVTKPPKSTVPSSAATTRRRSEGSYNDEQREPTSLSSSEQIRYEPQSWTDEQGWKWYRDEEGKSFLWQDELNDGEGAWVPWYVEE